MWELVLKGGRLLVTRTHPRFFRSTGVDGLSDPRISLSGPQVTSPLRSLRVSGNAPRWVMPKCPAPWEGRVPMSPPVGPPLQRTTRGPSVAPIQGLREAPQSHYQLRTEFGAGTRHSRGPEVADSPAGRRVARVPSLCPRRCLWVSRPEPLIRAHAPPSPSFPCPPTSLSRDRGRLAPDPARALPPPST